MPTPQDIMKSLGTSFWLKDALQTALERDPVDAARDAELLAEILKHRAEEVYQAAVRQAI